MEDRDKLMMALMQDMQHWSIDTLEAAFNYADEKCLEPANVADLQFWWYFRKAVRFQLDQRRQERL